MQVSRSGFYSWKTRAESSREREQKRLLPKVKEIHRQTKASYGARRISKELEAQGESCGRAKAEKELPIQTDISFTWEPKKTGRRITGILFRISSTKKPGKPKQDNGAAIPKALLELIPAEYRDNKQVINAIRRNMKKRRQAVMISMIPSSPTTANIQSGMSPRDYGTVPLEKRAREEFDGTYR